MDNVRVLAAGSMGTGFIPEEFLCPGQDQYTIRNEQFALSGLPWRGLTTAEREALVENGNRSDEWDRVLVTDDFDTTQIRDSRFHGLVRIGAVGSRVLEHHDLRLPVGITGSRIVSCDIGNNVAIHNVRYLAYCIVGDRSVLFNIDEMNTTSHARFGNGVIRDGEDEATRIEMDVVNEAGTRSVRAFEGMLPADAYLWARYREDEALQQALAAFTDGLFDARRGTYATIGEQTVIKECRIIKDVQVGPHAYIKGANKLKNLTICSSEQEPCQVGEGVELVNGIVGPGCRVFYGSKAVRFVMGSNCELKYGARLIHSYLGDNSTVSCCEILNNLIFPAHEQHHNNSFLIASLVMGQSNVAAGATIGSNHNSRAADSEVQAGRGFWPGLTASLKHSSRFASFVLIAKGSYPAELDVRLPFSLVSNNVARNQLEIMPAYWWLYNMYALARNDHKFAARDLRAVKAQHIEYQALAPDTVEEIIFARELLEVWIGMASTPSDRDAVRLSSYEPAGNREYRAAGQRLLHGLPADVDALTVLAPDCERSSRDAVILKPRQAWEAYGQMLHHYAARNLVAYAAVHADQEYPQILAALGGERVAAWENLGGQLVPTSEVDRLRSDAGSGAIASWQQVHDRYDELWNTYETDKHRHAFAVFALLVGSDSPDESAWRAFLEQGLQIQELVADRVEQSRAKDYRNIFRAATYRNDEEMRAALGLVSTNEFVMKVRQETVEYGEQVRRIVQGS